MTEEDFFAIFGHGDSSVDDVLQDEDLVWLEEVSGRVATLAAEGEPLDAVAVPAVDWALRTLFDEAYRARQEASVAQARHRDLQHTLGMVRRMVLASPMHDRDRDRLSRAIDLAVARYDVTAEPEPVARSALERWHAGRRVFKSRP